jgi:hypothetical protein
MELNQYQRPAQQPRPAQETRNCTHCGKPMRPVRPETTPLHLAEPAPNLAATPNTALRTHFAAYTREYILRLPAEPGATASLPLQQQRTSGGFHTADTNIDENPGEWAAIIPAEGYYICLWEAGIVSAEGVAALELGVNGGGSILAERLEPGYYSGQQHTWFNQGDRVTLRLRQGGGMEATIEGGAAQLTLIRLG